MTTSRFIVFCCLAALFVWAMRAALVRDYTKPNVELFTEMAHSVAAESFDTNGVLPGGVVQQSPPPGALYRGQLQYPYLVNDDGELVFPYGDGPEEAERAGRELSNPHHNPNAEMLERGKTLFRANCASCHGLDGAGDTPLTRVQPLLKPPSLVAGNALTLSDGRMFHIMSRGQNAGRMPPHADRITPVDRWGIVSYLRILQGRPDKDNGSTP